MKTGIIVSTWLLAASLFLSGCGFQKQADAKFGGHYFKTAIALIELHKVHTSAYPDSLNDISYTGDWDRLPLSSVKYAKLDDGYELDLVQGWVGQPTLTYPPEFWTGLGLRRSNMKPAP